MLEKVPFIAIEEHIDRAEIVNVFPETQNPHALRVVLRGGKATCLTAHDTASCKHLMAWLISKSGSFTPRFNQSSNEPLIIPTKGSAMKELFGDLKGYLRDNRDLLYTIVLVLIIDEYVFQGVFRDRIKALVESMLKKVEGSSALTTTATKVE